MIDRPKGGESAVLVHIDFPTDGMQEDLAEFEELTRSAGASCLQVITGARSIPDAKYFVGSGKAEEIRLAVAEHSAELVIFNHVLTPAQERNLERIVKCRVIDRTGLILDIFAQRARSFEGKLQVELAVLKHLSTRLVRGWTHLERQRGGIGLRGPGETQLETDRRLIRARIKNITERLKKVRQQRAQGRRARKRAIIPTVALVGYTNAGKSTLFNRLCGAEVFAADQLFATLDPTLRRLQMKTFGAIILADTVGFIRHLPHDLIEAFRATLEEVSEADLLLHVVDVHDERMQDNIDQVNTVLDGIGAETIPQLLVFNKIDMYEDMTSVVDHEARSKVWISAKTGLGLDQLEESISEALGENLVQKSIVLKPEEGRLRAKLYSLHAVISESIDPQGSSLLVISLPKLEWEKIDKERN